MKKPCWLHDTSASSSLNFWVESFQFHAGIFNAELPVDPALFGIRLVRPGCNFTPHSLYQLPIF